MANRTEADDLLRLSQEIRDGTDVVGVTAALLRYGREKEEIHSQAQNQPSFDDGVAAISEDVTQCLDRRLDHRLDAREREGLADLLGTQSHVPLVVRASAMAQAIDECCAHVFPLAFQERRVVRLREGDPYPVAFPHPGRHAGLLAPPFRRPMRCDEVPHLRIADPSAREFEIVYDFRLYGRLRRLADSWPPSIATCHPNVTDAEFLCSSVGGRRFFGVGPRDSPKQAAVSVRILRAAVELGADIAVFPELSADENVLHALHEAFVELKAPKLLVAGSLHRRDRQGKKRNLAVAWIRGARSPMRHYKIQPFHLHCPEGPPLTEDIHVERRPRLTVLFTGSWSLGFVICRDLLDARVPNTLARLGMNLLLVPVMSDDLGTFEGEVTPLVARTQGFVALANNPREWTGAFCPGELKEPVLAQSACFGQPISGRVAGSVSPPAGASPPGLFLLKDLGDEPRWVAVEDS